MAYTRTTLFWLLQEYLRGAPCELAAFQIRAEGSKVVWQPRINCYRCHDRFVICVELAGIDRADLDLRVEPMRVILTGTRPASTPEAKCGPVRQILALEIDEGRCEREISLPERVVASEARAEQRNGLLWIELPLESST